VHFLVDCGFVEFRFDLEDFLDSEKEFWRWHFWSGIGAKNAAEAVLVERADLETVGVFDFGSDEGVDYLGQKAKQKTENKNIHRFWRGGLDAPPSDCEPRSAA